MSRRSAGPPPAWRPCWPPLRPRLPGIAFARNGGPGGTTSVFIRGGEARHTAVYLDGVRLDSQATGGAIWEQIPLAQIERIEVLRGPAGGVYGSDAVAGVVQLFTRRGREGWRPSGYVGAGSDGLARVEAGLSGAGAGLDYALSLSHDRADGINARPIPTANPDRDGWRRDAGSGQLGWQLDRVHRVDATLLATRLRAQYDASASADDVATHTLRSGTLGWQAAWNGDATTRLQLGESRSTYESQPSFYRTETRLRNLLLQHEQRLGSQRLSVALERREDALLNPATAFAATLAGERHQDALALGWRGDFGAHALQAHLRHDRDSSFGGKDTGGLAWGWAFAPGWRATASAATSFRAPTLYQRFSEYGVATLQPESGRNLELGLRWADGEHGAELSTWRNRVRDLINFGGAGACASPFGCYENVGAVRYEGVTLAGRTRIGAVALRGSLDWHDPRNLATGKTLARRARRVVRRRHRARRLDARRRAAGRRGALGRCRQHPAPGRLRPGEPARGAQPGPRPEPRGPGRQRRRQGLCAGAHLRHPGAQRAAGPALVAELRLA
ncbi:TonB-dependent receptor domain-containing protein [Piscinibacter sakaiensis]